MMLCAGIPLHIYESLKSLCCLANSSGPIQAHEVAAAADLRPAQTAKILQLMVWAGFVESRRGTEGGYWLAKPACEIRVTDVTDFYAHHSLGHGPKKQNGLLRALKRATARCRKEFEQITVADLAKVCDCKPHARHTETRSLRRQEQREERPSATL